MHDKCLVFPLWVCGHANYLPRLGFWMHVFVRNRDTYFTFPSTPIKISRFSSVARQNKPSVSIFPECYMWRVGFGDCQD